MKMSSNQELRNSKIGHTMVMGLEEKPGGGERDLVRLGAQYQRVEGRKGISVVEEGGEWRPSEEEGVVKLRAQYTRRDKVDRKSVVGEEVEWELKEEEAALEKVKTEEKGSNVLNIVRRKRPGKRRVLHIEEVEEEEEKEKVTIGKRVRKLKGTNDAKKKGKLRGGGEEEKGRMRGGKDGNEVMMREIQGEEELGMRGRQEGEEEDMRGGKEREEGDMTGRGEREQKCLV